MKHIIETIHHLFVPRRSNAFKAKALHIDFLTFYLITALLLTFAFKHLDNATNILGIATDVTIDKLLELTNEKRTEANLTPLQYNDQLSKAAQQKAQDMFAKNYWSHYAPDGATPWDFILDSGYRYEYAGENLAKNFMFSDAVVNAWMDSPTHRENILRQEYSEIGFAIVNGTLNGEETTLVVQMFGKPLSDNTVAQTPESQPQESAKPAPVVNRYNETPVVLADSTQKTSILPFYLNLNYLFLILLVVALFVDFYIAKHFQLIRVGGKQLAHALFIMFIIAGIYFVTKGAIL